MVPGGDPYEENHHGLQNCAGECPVGAISAGDPTYVIDAEKCVSCGTCAGACPMEAIVAE